ncbi:MAG: RtcB family protein [Planctomycetota bacterium]|nr:MAG: RtcB family protein [Planctomycetota bacterium]
MNKKQLLKLGCPEDCVVEAIQAVQQAAMAGEIKGKYGPRLIEEILAAPSTFADHPRFGDLANALLHPEPVEPPREPIEYKVWGRERIDDNTFTQMADACRLPNAVGAALMPDAHLGYGLPIGGVLALEYAVCPYAVGVDIACRMKLSILDLPVTSLEDEKRSGDYDRALEKGTVFGAGGSHDRKQLHPVLDQDWDVTRVTRELKPKAWAQLGTSGSGNHFVEFGIVTLDQPELGLEPGRYVALLSHSGSRGPGYGVCNTYSSIAKTNLPRKYAKFGQLAWLDLDTEAGQEYWLAMNLMGDYAAANHDVIHKNVSHLIGAQIIAGVENHHNFAWKETHGGRDVIVHRKGATPAAAGELGVIPGSMASPAYIVRGRGNPESLNSASHGAGRKMSRTQGREKFRIKAVANDLLTKGVRVLSAGADEVPGVYKDIDEVMRQQADLVETIARFDPRIVKMCGDGSKAED